MLLSIFPLAFSAFNLTWIHSEIFLLVLNFLYNLLHIGQSISLILFCIIHLVLKIIFSIFNTWLSFREWFVVPLSIFLLIFLRFQIQFRLSQTLLQEFQLLQNSLYVIRFILGLFLICLLFLFVIFYSLFKILYISFFLPQVLL